MGVWSSDNVKLKVLLRDMGFIEWEDVPYWAQSLAENIIDAGWNKKGLK